MSLRLEMLQVARLSPKLLGESAELVQRFLLGQQNADGGFRDRSGSSDLYYTVFGLEGLQALQFSNEDVSRTFEKAREFMGEAALEALDFVHLCCLARISASLKRTGMDLESGTRRRLLNLIENFRSEDGGYNPTPHSGAGTVYGCFLGAGAIQDLEGSLCSPEGILRCLDSLKAKSGGWTNEHGVPLGSTNATAAAVALLRQFKASAPNGTASWLLSCLHPEGGFRAAPNTPLPDLLSTATALHALAGLEADLEPLKEKCLDFIDTLWTNEGGFYGYWCDETIDAEYTWYGLLALGHLSL
jgi:prenyltransferase beta subunit